MSTNFLTFDDIRAGRIPRHKYVRFQPRARGVGRHRAAGISRAWNCELLRAEISRHRYGDSHSTCLETLSGIDRLVFDPKFNLRFAPKLRCPEQWRSPLTERNGFHVLRQRQYLAPSPERSFSLAKNRPI